MSSRTRVAGILGAAGAMVGVAAAAGLAAERAAIGRARQHPDGSDAEPLALLAPDQRATVRTDDGVALHVESVNPPDPGLTVVFVHGYCLDLGTWHFPRRDLARMTNPAVRMVFYDQRGHGRSGRGERSADTIDQLGRDLAAVLDQCAPTGPLVLIGHSMGGMTVMALAEQRPELFRDRVVGVALLSTAAGDLDEVTFGMPRALTRVRKPLTPVVSRAMLASAAVVERGRRAGSDLAWLLTRRYAFGDANVSPGLVDFAERMIAGTPVETVASFLATLSDHDRYAALPVLDGIETLVLTGDRDLMTPLDHGRRLADALPGCEFVVIDGAGHLAVLERPDIVDAELEEFVRRAYRAVSQ